MPTLTPFLSALTPIVESWRFWGGGVSGACWPPKTRARSSSVSSEMVFVCMLRDDCTRNTNDAHERFRGARACSEAALPPRGGVARPATRSAAVLAGAAELTDLGAALAGDLDELARQLDRL